MMKYVYAALIGASVIAAAIAYLKYQENEAERRGAEQQIARDIAKANQEIATRRETDAKFDSQDARALCVSLELEWVFEDGKSFCR